MPRITDMPIAAGLEAAMDGRHRRCRSEPGRGAPMKITRGLTRPGKESADRLV